MPLGVIRDKKEQQLTITLSAPRKESSRLRGWTVRDKDGDMIEDDDDDMDVDFDMEDWDGAAGLVSQAAQQLAWGQAQKGMLTAQKAVNNSWKEVQPKIQAEMKKAHERFDEEMKHMEQQLRELQDKY